MSDLDIIHLIEQQINQSLKAGEFSQIMNWTARGNYIVNEQSQIIALNLRNSDFSNLI